MPWLVTDMDYKKNSTHAVIKFDEKTVDGKDYIDLIPLSWTYIENGLLHCKYPDKKYYATINKMSKKHFFRFPPNLLLHFRKL